MNFQTLGNALPHLHTHIVPRYIGDPAPGEPLPFDFSKSLPPERFAEDLTRLLA